MAMGATERNVLCPTEPPADVAIAAVTVAELLVGVRLASGKRRDAGRIHVGKILESLPIIAYDRRRGFEPFEMIHHSE